MPFTSTSVNIELSPAGISEEVSLMFSSHCDIDGYYYSKNDVDGNALPTGSYRKVDWQRRASDRVFELPVADSGSYTLSAQTIISGTSLEGLYLDYIPAEDFEATIAGGSMPKTGYPFTNNMITMINLQKEIAITDLNCDTSLAIYRSQVGTLDEHHDGGSISALNIQPLSER